MRGIAGYGVYVPHWRLDRKSLATALGAPSGSGTRSVAGYDEDTTSLGVEAARAALRAAPRLAPEALYFATALPAYLDKTNATAIHAALDLAPSAPAFDMAGALRPGPGPLPAGPGARGRARAALARISSGPPGGAVTEALKRAGVTAPSINHWVVTGPHARAARRLAGVVGATKGTVVDDLGAVIGNTGTAHAGLLLAHVLARAAPEQLIAVVSLADGCDVTVWRTTGGLAGRGSSVDAATRLEGGGQVSYANFLTWRGFLRREPPRRPDPQPPEAPPAARAEAWKFAFTGSRCQACGVRHLPPQRVCVKCHAVDRMAPERLADVPATIATFTVDRLAYSLSPPVVAAVIDFEGGGRFQCELTDVDPGAVRIGDRVAMTFRRLLTAGSVHNYFWKARPIL